MISQQFGQQNTCYQTFLWGIICDNKTIFAHARVVFETDTAKFKSAWMSLSTNFPTNSCDTSNG